MSDRVLNTHLGKKRENLNKKTEIKLSTDTVTTAWKVSKYGVISGPYFPVCGLNTETYGVNSVFSPNLGK